MQVPLDDPPGEPPETAETFVADLEGIDWQEDPDSVLGAHSGSALDESLERQQEIGRHAFVDSDATWHDVHVEIPDILDWRDARLDPVWLRVRSLVLHGLRDGVLDTQALAQAMAPDPDDADSAQLALAEAVEEVLSLFGVRTSHDPWTMCLCELWEPGPEPTDYERSQVGDALRLIRERLPDALANQAARNERGWVLGSNRGDAFDAAVFSEPYFKDIAKLPQIQAGEEKALGSRIREGDQEAVKRLIEGNLRFAVHIAKRYRGMGMPLPDLVQEGNLGLIEAAKRFDSDRGVKFISYAVWWIRQSIFRALAENRRAFRVPQKILSSLISVSVARESLVDEFGRAPGVEELVEETNLPRQDVEALMPIAGGDVSLSAYLEAEGSEPGDNGIQCPRESIADALARESFNGRIHEAVAHLDEKERHVVTLRFGLGGGEEQTLEEIGDAMSLSRERIRQIESKAKEKLGRSESAKKLRTDLN